MKMRIVDEKNKITLKELKKMAFLTFGQLIKAVVDIERKIMAIGGELHVDEERLLMEEGSKQENLWGINLYPKASVEDLIEYDSMINLRPHQGNLTCGIDDKNLKEKVAEVVNLLIER